MKAVLFTFAALALLVLGAVALFGRQIQPSSVNVQPAAVSAGSGTDRTATFSGVLICLPRRLPGAECALGIQTTDGAYYGMRDSNGASFDPSHYVTGQRAEVIGVVRSDLPLQERYNIVGVIVAQSVHQ